MKDLFISFLKRECVLTAFKKNMDVNMSFDKYVSHVSPNSYVDCAFSWGNTHQGQLFWNTISIAWDKELFKQQENEKNN